MSACRERLALATKNAADYAATPAGKAMTELFEALLAAYGDEWASLSEQTLKGRQGAANQLKAIQRALIQPDILPIV